MDEAIYFSAESGSTYPSWEALVEAEANGYGVIGWIDEPNTVPVVFGPYATKREAHNARIRLRTRWRKEYRPELVHTIVRPLWKDPRDVRR